MKLLRFVFTIVILLSIYLLSACTKILTTPVGKFAESQPKGFVSEIDEPSARGRTARITLPEMDIQGRFCISPDGKSLVFSGKPEGSSDLYQLYKLDMGSGAPVKITAGGNKHAFDPSFTSDGEFIVYRTENSFWKINKNGSGSRVKLPGSGLPGRDWNPQVSVNDKIVFVTWDKLDNKSLIWTVGLDGSELTQFREGYTPTWSPDGSKIVFEYDGDIWLMNTDGRELTQLTITENIDEGLPNFSPDGTKIVFASNEESSNSSGNNINIWYININGSEKTQVTELKSWDSWPTWGNDGIYFLSGRGKTKKNISRIWKITSYKDN